jgi:hypothetical protein
MWIPLCTWFDFILLWELRCQRDEILYWIGNYINLEIQLDHEEFKCILPSILGVSFNSRVCAN